VKLKLTLSFVLTLILPHKTVYINSQS